MLRGDDVAELQRRLNALGFDAGREDGILGTETETALRQFQQNVGATADGVCGPSTLAAIARVSGLAAGSVASVREREDLRREPCRLDGLRVFLVAEPAMSALAHSVYRAMGNLGAVVALDVSGDDPSVLTAQANRFAAGRVPRPDQQRRSRRAVCLLLERNLPIGGGPRARAPAHRIAAHRHRRCRRADRAHLPLLARDPHDGGGVRTRRPRPASRRARSSPPSYRP